MPSIQSVLYPQTLRSCWKPGIQYPLWMPLFAGVHLINLSIANNPMCLEYDTPKQQVINVGSIKELSIKLQNKRMKQIDNDIVQEGEIITK